VDGRAEDVEAKESDQPKNQKTDYDVPKHKIVSARGRLAESGEILPNFVATAIPIGKAVISATVSLL